MSDYAALIRPTEFPAARRLQSCSTLIPSVTAPTDRGCPPLGRNGLANGQFPAFTSVHTRVRVRWIFLGSTASVYIRATASGGG